MNDSTENKTDVTENKTDVTETENKALNKKEEPKIERSAIIDEDLLKRIQKYKDLEKSITEQQRRKDLSTAIYSVRNKYPLIGSIMQSMTIQYSNNIPTLGVSYEINDQAYKMWINPVFFCKVLNEKHRAAVLLHEISHITHQHLIRVPFRSLPSDKLRIFNIALDMAINQFIPDLPNGCDKCSPPEQHIGKPCENEDCPGRCILLEHYWDIGPKGEQIPWDKYKAGEYYYEKLIQRLSENENDDDDGDGNGDGPSSGTAGSGKAGNGKPGKNISNGLGKGKGTGYAKGSIDEHNWQGGASEHAMLDALEDLIKRAMIKESYDFNKLPGMFKELLQDIELRKKSLDYKRLILSAIKRHATGIDRKSTWLRPNRRFGMMTPGTKVGNLPKLQIFIDTSGSISIEEANEFLGIADEFLKVGSRKCELNLFHTKNYYSKSYKIGQKLVKKDFESGGTDLKDSLQKSYKAQSDLAIFLTDGFYDDVEYETWQKSHMKQPQTLWIISKDGQVDHPIKRLGNTIKIPNVQK